MWVRVYVTRTADVRGILTSNGIKMAASSSVQVTVEFDVGNLTPLSGSVSQQMAGAGETGLGG